MTTREPTPRQIRALESFGITAPDTKAACSNLIHYILEDEDKKFARAGYVKKSQEKWNGKKICRPSDNRTGVVRYVLRSIHIVGETEEISTALSALVDWDGDFKSSQTGLHLLTLV